MSWQQSNPVTGDRKDGALYRAVDPLGSLVGPLSPYNMKNPNPTYEEMVGERHLFVEDGNPFGAGMDCGGIREIDGLPADCSQIQRMMQNGLLDVRLDSGVFTGKFTNVPNRGGSFYIPESVLVSDIGGYSTGGAIRLGVGTLTIPGRWVNFNSPQAEIARSSENQNSSIKHGIDWFKQAVINQTIALARKALENPKCYEFLKPGNKDPQEELDKYAKRAKPDDSTFTNPDGTKGQAIADTGGSIGNLFFTHSVGGKMYILAPKRYLTPAEGRVSTILHEVGHLTGAPGENHYSKHINGRTYVDLFKSQAYTKSIVERCLESVFLSLEEITL